MYHYSPSTGGFFHPEVHAEIPEDAIQISESDHANLMAGQASGQCIVPGEGGRPVLACPPPPTVTELHDKLSDDATVLLASSDLVVMRCYELGKKIPKSWVAYREELRQIVRRDPDAINRGIPERPAYPA